MSRIQILGNSKGRNADAIKDLCRDASDQVELFLNGVAGRHYNHKRFEATRVVEYSFFRNTFGNYRREFYRRESAIFDIRFDGSYKPRHLSLGLSAQNFG